MSKRIADFIFIIIATAILIGFSEYGILEEYIGFTLIPILIAFYLGQFVQRKFKK